VVYNISKVNVRFSDIIKLHNNVYEQMFSRKLVFKLFEYKEDHSPLRKDVAALLLDCRKNIKYDKSYFCEQIISKFSKF
jgi:hypothetical protein